MEELEMIEMILDYVSTAGAYAAVARLELLRVILEGTPSYMHRDVVTAAFKRADDGRA